MEYDLNEVCETLQKIARGSGEILMEYFETDKYTEHTKATVADIVTDADIASDKFIREQLQLHYPNAGMITEEGSNILPKGTGQEVWFTADPLDGTTNFSCNMPIFSVSIAMLDKDYQPLVGVIYDPTRDEMFYAIKGKGAFLQSPRGKRQLHVRENVELIKCLVGTGFNPSHVSSKDNNLAEISRILPQVRCLRRCGSACLDCCYVAAARLDCYWENGPHIWDIAAGWCIVVEAGGVATHYDGSPFTRESLLQPQLTIIMGCKTIHDLIQKNIQEARANL